MPANNKNADGTSIGADRLKRLRKFRGAHRGATTQYINNLIQQNIGTLDVRVLAKMKSINIQLKEKQRNIEQMDNQILEKCPLSTKAQNHNQIISTKSICHALREAHGLMEDTVMMSLDYMVDSGKIFREICGESESLGIVGTNKRQSSEDFMVNELETESENEKLTRYRKELLETASMHDSVVNRSREKDTEVNCDSFLKEPEVNSNSYFMKTGVELTNPPSVNTLKRLKKLEEQVNLISKKIGLNKKDEGTEKGKTPETEIFWSQINVLETEIKGLSEENSRLKMDNAKLQDIILNNISKPMATDFSTFVENSKLQGGASWGIPLDNKPKGNPTILRYSRKPAEA